MAIQWMTLGGVYVNEAATGIEWMTPGGVYINEQAAAGSEYDDDVAEAATATEVVSASAAFADAIIEALTALDVVTADTAAAAASGSPRPFQPILTLGRMLGR